MVDNVDNYIRGLNYGYENALREEGVQYINSLATFSGSHEVSFLGEDGKQATASAEKFIIAVGGRPTYVENNL